MKKLLLLLALSFPVCASAAPPTSQASLSPAGYCQLSVTTVVQTSTCSGGIPARSIYALICNEGAAARWRDDGVAPTTSVGMPTATGTATAPVCFNYYGTFATLQWIAQAGTSIINISFYK